MIKYIVPAVFILVAGCTSNNNVTPKQVTQTPITQQQVNPNPVQITSQTRKAGPLYTSTQASSTATSWTNAKVSAKGTQNGIPPELLNLLQPPGTNQSAGQAPASPNTGNKTYPGYSNGNGYGNGTTTTTPGQGQTTTPGQTAPGQATPGQTTPGKTTSGQTPGAQKDSSQYAQQVLDLVNQERSKAGLSSLSMNDQLAKMAMAKAEDMYNNNYFDHNSPTYGSPFDMMKQYGITYNTAGENIAKGQTSPSQVMKDWMNSPGHKANILNNSYKNIGIAFYNNEWVQEFTG
ncbi:CAP domain-containing protein [Paenibacillus sp. KQZ6P-2]|uniref:CAP domain-containing protein n=1 Tax=Paenibacillus mangrovi TaxID=2931978 RepID=A0A9X1WTL4_9BACL|nr:CAP domain-containing protein [Paenibacillus mangrovi]MCJ8013675.1 CAP domain-containing protein [Paenibacillus mangrovi]